MKESSKAWKLVSWVCLLIGVYALCTLVLILVRGGEWDTLITVNNPKKRMAAAFLAFAGGYLTRGGRVQKTAREWAGELARLALLSASLGLSFLAGELALRSVLRRNQGSSSLEKLAEKQAGKNIELRSFHPLAAIVQLSPNKRLVYELMPGLDMEFGNRTLKTNAGGLRDSFDYAKQKPPGVFRILGVGDSGMFGWNVHQGEDYLAVLEENLRQRAGARYEVLNLAVPGYNTFQELEMLRFRGLAYEPDLVIVGWCDNDFGPPFFLIEQSNFRRRDVSYLYHLAFNRKEFQRLIKPGVMKSSEIDRAFVDPQVAEYTDVSGVKKAFSEMQALAKEQGFHLLVFGPMNKHATAIFRELGLDHANTHELVPKGKYPPEYEVHFMHPRAGGHRALAEELERLLEQKGWLNPPGHM